ncbi:response regulator [Halobacterium sp. R2-5]|uniref:hybrid sensor histidine kinase/response regulator n=1 Tax=Halobacterium sp. R2-5 TaxID=2715751 RepID=UPI00141F4995|nr:response regulator [Halobacterium sp. R2-5]NIC00780.1 response regulator [Halobacterium sp. R2-5]
MDEPIRVLHVDDEPGFAELTADFLEREDERFAVETATRTSAALEYLADHGVDCVISDYDMPEMNGIEFLETVRESFPELPFVLFTGKGSEEVASDAISAGVTDYLQKQQGTDHYALLANRVRNAVRQSRTERVAEDTQQQLAELAEHTNDVLWTFSADWDELLFVNDAYEDIWGRSVASLEADPRSFLDGVHPEDRERVEAAMSDLSAGEHFDVEYRVNEAEDYGRWVWARGEPIIDDGEVVRVTGFSRDITERKARERDLQRTNAVLSTLVDTLPVGVLAEDADRNVLAANQRLVDIFGFSGAAGDLVGMDCERLAVEASDRFADPDEFVASVDELVAANESVVGEEVALADGRTFEQSHRPIELPDGRGHLWMYRDVSERVGREERLRALSETTRELLSAESREQAAETAVAAARDIVGLEASAIHLYDDEANALVPVAISEAARDIVDDPPTFTPGSSIAWRVFEDGEPLAIDDVHADPDAYRSDSPVRSEVFLPLGEHGILVSGSTSPAAFDEQDVALGEVLAGNIVTALEQVERTAELRDRERELERQNERLSEFASVLSHDLRNPLNVAQGNLELAREDCDSDHLDEAATAHERMQALIEDLLALTSDGGQSTDVGAVDLRALAEESWASVDTADAALTVDAGATIRADEGRVRRLFENLFRNAVEHGSTVDRNAKRSEDAVEHTNDDVSVTVGELDGGFYVADDGPGIPESERERVFEYGYSTEDDGTGFGLRIVEQVADAHDWSVRVTDSRGGGARFEVTGVETAEE